MRDKAQRVSATGEKDHLWSGKLYSYIYLGLSYNVISHIYYHLNAFFTFRFPYHMTIFKNRNVSKRSDSSIFFLVAAVISMFFFAFHQLQLKAVISQLVS